MAFWHRWFKSGDGLEAESHELARSEEVVLVPFVQEEPPTPQPQAVMTTTEWVPRPRRSPRQDERPADVSCSCCSNVVGAWRTYADGTVVCLGCAVKGGE